MQPREAFEIKLDGGAVRGNLWRPLVLEAGADSPAPVVLICRGVHIEGEDAGGLFEDIVEALCMAGIAVVSFDHRCADLILEDFHAHCAADDLTDAQAALAWIASRDDLDAERIGVLGHSLGAIAATLLSAQEPSIARLCLLNAITAKYLCSTGRGGESDGALNPEPLPDSYLPSLAELDTVKAAAAIGRPTLLLHAAADRTVPPQISLEYLQGLEQAGCDVEHVLVAQADHIFSTSDARNACIDQLLRFFTATAAHSQPAKLTAKAAAV